MSKTTPNKYCSVRRRESRSLHDERKENLNKKPRTVDIIEVIAEGDDPESAVLSLNVITARFREGLILFDHGKIKIYFDTHGRIRAGIKNISEKHKKKVSELYDIYTTYTRFIAYQDEMGTLMVLPNNVYCSSIFNQLNEDFGKNGIRPLKAAVKLEDLLRPEITIQSSLTTCEECAKQFSGPMTFTNHCTHDRNKLKREASNCTDMISLIVAKKKIFHGIEKVPVAYKRRSRLPKTKPQYKEYTVMHVMHEVRPAFYDRFQLARHEHVQDENGFDPSHSQQAISTDNSIMFNREISYGIGQRSGANYYRNNLSAIATNNSQLTEGESSNTTQRQSDTPRYPRYDNYPERLKSYARWIARRPEPTTLSHAGFFFTSGYFNV